MNAAHTRATIFLRELDIIKSCFTVMTLLCAMIIVAATLHAATMAKVTAQLATLNPQQKRDFLVKGAQAERELMFLWHDFGGRVHRPRQSVHGDSVEHINLGAI